LVGTSLDPTQLNALSCAGPLREWGISLGALAFFWGGTPEIGAPLRVGFRCHALASHSLLLAPGLRTYGRRLAFTGAGARPKSPIAAPASDGVNGAIGLPFGGKSEHEL
jgi:hypothetical protein